MSRANGQASVFVDLSSRSMDAGEAARAAIQLKALEGYVRERGRDSVPDLSELWTSFTKLLSRRGYFVLTPDETAKSLEEIRGVGAGFDLYDLGLAMGRLDAAATECLQAAARRSFPALVPMVPSCGCGHHAKEDRR
jgi:hypothetical protein